MYTFIAYGVTLITKSDQIVPNRIKSEIAIIKIRTIFYNVLKIVSER